MVTLKNVLGVIGIAVIALFWVALINIWGGLFVIALVVVAVVVLTLVQRRKKVVPPTTSDESSVR